jgi:hypothetical protein
MELKMNIETILTEAQLKKLSDSDIKAINEAITTYYDNTLNAKQAELEKETSGKFELLVEGLSKKFDEQVTNVIVENAKHESNNLINSKLYNIVKGVVNLLENSGITTTEKTKELQEKLNKANENILQSWHEREIVQKQLTDSEKENYILMQLKGMNPEIVTAAIEYFDGKDILDVQDGLQTFVDGDFPELNLDRQDELSGDLDLEEVERACEEIGDTNASRNKQSNKLIGNSKQKVFENLSKGLNQRKSIALAGPDISEKTLQEAAEQSANSNLEPVEEDAKQAMEQIDNFSNLGLNFGDTN